MREMKETLQDDLIYLTNKAVQSRREQEAEARRRKKARRFEIAAQVTAVAGAVVTFLACLCVENDAGITLWGGLIGLGIIGLSQVFELPKQEALRE